MSLRFDVFASLLRILGLHDDHVSAVAALLHEPSSSRAWLNGRDHLDEVAADWYEEVLQPPLLNRWILEDKFCA